MNIKRIGSLIIATAVTLCFVTILIANGTNLVKAETLDVQTRLDNSDLPSVFQAWNDATAGPGITGDRVNNISKHDLYWGGVTSFGLQWNNSYEGLGTEFTASSITNARNFVNSLRAKNPNIVVLMEVRYFVSWDSYLPLNSPWWKRDENGDRVPMWGYNVLDWENAEFRAQVAQQCKAVADLDFMDGVLIDCFGIDQWVDSDSDANRVDMIRRIRENIGEKIMIINGNMFKKPAVAQYVNGIFMESYDSATPDDWKLIRDTLLWAEENLRQPVVNCVEVWWDSSRNDLYKMRAVTTLTLTHSNGYALFGDTWSHSHNWYDFWDTDLGKPVTEGFQRPSDEMYQREFTKGTAIYNQKGNGSKTITFNETRKSAAFGTTGTTFTVNENDGDIFTYVGTPPSNISKPAQTMFTYNYIPSLCKQQGVSNWYTQNWDGSSYTDMEWNVNPSTSYRYLDNNNTIFGPLYMGGRIDINNSNVDVVAKWIAPSSGNVTITGPAYKNDLGGDGVKLTIKKNNTVIYGPTVITSTSPTNISVSTTVNEGDAIYCIANANGTITGDSFFWKPTAKHYTNTSNVNNLGDLNGDTNITATDALIALQAASGRITLTDAQKAVADVTGDGKVTAVDALKILQFASGRITSLE